MDPPPDTPTTTHTDMYVHVGACVHTHGESLRGSREGKDRQIDDIRDPQRESRGRDWEGTNCTSQSDRVGAQTETERQEGGETAQAGCRSSEDSVL